jgi:predicted HicB family RNase H-like nuclease
MSGDNEKTKDPSGTFTVRIDPGLHAKLKRMSQLRGISINSIMVIAIERELSEWELIHCPSCGRRLQR